MWTDKIYVHDHSGLIYLAHVRDSHKRECRVEATTRYDKSKSLTFVAKHSELTELGGTLYAKFYCINIISDSSASCF